MKRLLTTVALRVAGWCAVMACLQWIAGALRPRFYPDGLPGAVVLGMFILIIAASMWWLVGTFFPVYEEVEDRIRRRYSNQSPID